MSAILLAPLIGRAVLATRQLDRTKLATIEPPMSPPA
jgi:hypothetical protein